MKGSPLGNKLLRLGEDHFISLILLYPFKPSEIISKDYFSGQLGGDQFFNDRGTKSFNDFVTIGCLNNGREKRVEEKIKDVLAVVIEARNFNNALNHGHAPGNSLHQFHKIDPAFG